MTSHHQGLDQAYYNRDGFRITAIALQAHDRSYSTSSIIGVDIHLTFHVKSWKTDEKRVLAKVHYARYSG